MLRRSSVASRGVYVCTTIDEYPPRGGGHDRAPFGIDWLSPKDWPLFTRAWVCQEYLLSPRILFAGHRNLMWECSESLCDELLGPIERFPEATASKTHFSVVRSTRLPVTSMPVQVEFVQNWGRLVRHYRTGVLTQPKDRIMAFAGVAQAVHDSSGMTYLAGCWAQMFPFSFTWSLVIPWDKSTMIEVEAIIEAVPSWSWFSVPIFSSDTFRFEVVEDLSRVLRLSATTRAESMYEATLLSFEDRSQQTYAGQQAYAGPLSTKDFHNFTGMTLNLAMKTWTGFLENPMNLDLRRGPSIRDQFNMLLGQDGGFLQCQFDHQETERNHYDKVMTFGLLIELRAWLDLEYNFFDFEQPLLIGLIMQPEPSRETYKRIGLWKLRLYQYPLGWDAETFNAVSIFDQLKDVRSEHIRLV
jgi:hypothetical protein